MSGFLFPRKTHACGELTPEMDGNDVTLTGWVSSPRMLGPIAFAPLRDTSGSVQLVWENQHVEIANQLGPEFVLAVKGVVRKRPDSQIRRNQISGAIEV
jgi:aspartyl-tRNA synthetase